ncbi:MAG: hypothetical protein AAGD17_06575 [Bacteroidota bacterium]
MPANAKYLSSGRQRFLKTSAGILGGFIVTILLHNAIGTMLVAKGPLIITTGYSSFIVWAALLVIAFMAKNGWKIWGIYLLLIALFGTIIYLNQ